MEGVRLLSVVSPLESVSINLLSMINAEAKDGYPMAEAVDEATFVVRRFLEDPKNDSVRPNNCAELHH